MSLILRTSQNIAHDLTRNSSTYCMTWRAAESAEAYTEMLEQRVEAGELESYVLEMEVVECGAGVFGLKHHDGLAGVEMEMSREDFEALPESEREAALMPFTWGAVVGMTEGMNAETYVSFDAGEAELVWSNGHLHVFEVNEFDLNEEQAPHFTFIDAWC